MKWIAGASLLIVFAGCKSAETCSDATVCAGGTYQLCTADSTRCRIVTSDGNSFTCNSCSDCAGALAEVVSWCHPGGDAGVGDAGGSGEGARDLAVPLVADMTSRPDLAPLSCAGIFNCSETCFAKADLVGCDNACAARGSPASQQQFHALEQCIFSYCILDASAQSIGACTVAALSNASQCRAQAMACQ